MFYIFLMFTISFFEFAQGHYFFAEKWTNPDLPEKRIYCLADCHEATKKSNRVGRKQQEDAIELHKRLGAVAIVEDSEVWHDNAFKEPLKFRPSNYVLKLAWLRLRQSLTHDMTPLQGLASFLEADQIHRVNIEFRVIKVLSIDSTCFTSYGLTPPIAAKTTFEYLQQIIDIIKGFDDGAICNQFYKENVAKVETLSNGMLKEFLAMFKDNEKPFGKLLEDQNFCDQAIEAYINSQYDRTLAENEICNDPEDIQKMRTNSCFVVANILSTFDAELVDCLILNTLVWYHQKVPTVIIHAGAFHIKNIRPTLKKLGYIPTTLAGAEHVPYFEDPGFDEKYYTQEPDAIDLKTAFANELPED